MSDLSPFHQELFSFLQQSAKRHAEEEGFDLEHDPELQKFHHLIDLQQANEFHEIVANYQHIFGERGPIHTENCWMNSFSEKEFADLGLARYFPKIYRALPRLYHREDPSRSRIKKNFTRVSDLKRLAVDRAVFSLYEGKWHTQAFKIAILTHVLPDGLGDWVAATETASLLSSKYPFLEVHLFAKAARELPKENLPFHVHVFDEVPRELYRNNLKNRFLSASALPHNFRSHSRLASGQWSLTPNKNFEEPSCQIPDPSSYFGINEMDFVLQIPTLFPADLTLNARMEKIGEYGFLESEWFHPKSGNRSMGLHVLEKGIFTRKSVQPTFAEIEQKELLVTLFGMETPGAEEIVAYRQRHQFHLAYLATPIGGAIYLHSLLKMKERDEKEIDICSPHLSWLITWLKEEKAFLAEPFGVKEVQVLFNGHTHRIPIAEKGKTVRIISPGALSVADMRRLYFLSDDWVAVRGNQSLSEAISAKKAFFYDGRDHARYLIKDLSALAENRLQGHRSALHAFRMMGQAFLWNLPEEQGTWVDESFFQRAEKLPWLDIAIDLGVTLQDSDAIVGFKKICTLISEEHSFNSFLFHLIERELFHAKNPAVRELEEKLMRLYANSEISFSTLVKNLSVGIVQNRDG